MSNSTSTLANNSVQEKQINILKKPVQRLLQFPLHAATEVNLGLDVVWFCVSNMVLHCVQQSYHTNFGFLNCRLL